MGEGVTVYFDSIIHDDPIEESYYVRPQVNYCKTELISTCTCGPSLMQQRVCSFFDKSTQAERCMYRVFDRFCDNHKAQMAYAKEKAQG